MCRKLWTVLVLGSLLLCVCKAQAFGSNAKMKGPAVHRPATGGGQRIRTSPLEVSFLGSIRFYQARLSPIGGNRCGFRPSCSHFGYQAIEEEGIMTGLMMTTDRLMRCNIWKRPGPDYTLLPTGKLYDPVSKNLPFKK